MADVEEAPRFSTLLVIRHHSVPVAVVLVPFYLPTCETRTRQCLDTVVNSDPIINLNRHRQSLLLEIFRDHHHHEHHLLRHNRDVRHARNLSDINSIYIRREVIREIGENRCPILNDLNHSMVPLCPTHDVLEYDENRTPAVMRQVKCSCNSCLGSATEQHRCAPIYTYEQVLRVVGCDRTNYYVYALVWEPVSIGCECRALSDEEKRRINNYVMPP